MSIVLFPVTDAFVMKQVLRADVSKNQTATVKKSILLILSSLIPYHVRRTPVQFVLKNIFSLGRIDIFAREGKYANLIA